MIQIKTHILSLNAYFLKDIKLKSTWGYIPFCTAGWSVNGFTPMEGTLRAGLVERAVTDFYSIGVKGYGNSLHCSELTPPKSVIAFTPMVETDHTGGCRANDH